MSETSRHRAQTAPYCSGSGLDIGSSGDPVVPTAISVELCDEAAEIYGTTRQDAIIQLRGDGRDLVWFRDGVLDFVYSSHLLEDFANWRDVLREWMRVVKPGGHLVLLVPEVSRWDAALRRGQPPNPNHAQEFQPGEIADWIRETQAGWEVVEDRYAAEGDLDYSWLVAARRNA